MPKHRMLSTCPLSRPRCSRRTRPARVRVEAAVAGTTKAAQDAALYYKSKGLLSAKCDLACTGSKGLHHVLKRPWAYWPSSEPPGAASELDGSRVVSNVHLKPALPGMAGRRSVHLHQHRSLDPPHGGYKLMDCILLIASCYYFVDTIWRTWVLPGVFGLKLCYSE